MGGSFEETDVGGFVVFHGFRPPYDESRPVPAAQIRLETTAGAPIGAAALDRDPATAWTSAEGLGRGSGVVVRVTPARRLSALVLVLDLEASPLAVPVGRLDRRRGGGAGAGARRLPVGERGAARGQAGAAGRAPRGPRGGRGAARLPGAGAAAHDRRGLPLRPGARRSGPRPGPRPRGTPSSRRGRAAGTRRCASTRRPSAWSPSAPRTTPPGPGPAGARRSRRWLDVESLDDGGPELVEAR